MAYGNRVKTDALTTTYADEVYTLGTVFVESADEVAATNPSSPLIQGVRTWVFIKATAAIAAGQLVKRLAIGVPYEGQPDNSDEGAKWNMLGVAGHTINNGQFGWIVKSGSVVGKAEGSVAAGDFMASDGNTAVGQLDTWTGGAGLSKGIVGIALEAEGATVATYAAMKIDIP